MMSDGFCFNEGVRDLHRWRLGKRVDTDRDQAKICANGHQAKVRTDRHLVEICSNGDWAMIFFCIQIFLFYFSA